jgi:hypothetical protein
MIRVQTFYIDGQPYVNGEWREWKPELNSKYNKDESDFASFCANNNETFSGTYQVYSLIHYQTYDKEAMNTYGSKGVWKEQIARVDGWINPQGTDCMNIGKGDNGVGYLYQKVYPKIFEIMNIPLPDDKSEHNMALYYLIDHINLIRGVAVPMWYATYRFNFEIVRYMITYYQEFVELIKKFHKEYKQFTHTEHYSSIDYAKENGWDGKGEVRDWYYRDCKKELEEEKK